MDLKAIMCFGVMVASSVLLQDETSAAKIDKYRAIMESGAFTLKYEVEPVKVNPNKSELYTKDGKTYFIQKSFNPQKKKTLQDWYAEEHKDIPTCGTIVVNGNNHYMEVLYNDRNIALPKEAGNDKDYKLLEIANIGNYYLLKNNEKFYFVSGSKKGQEKNYFGTVGKPGAIRPNESFLSLFFSEDVEAMLEANYGNPVIGRILAAIYTDKTLSNAYVPQNYKLSNSGTTDNGEIYEEYVGTQDNASCSVKFFFTGDKLVKATSVYKRKGNSDKLKDTQLKNTIYFKTFSSVPDEEYFNLPKEIEVVKD